MNDTFENFDPFEQMIFNYDRCFVCGTFLNSYNSSLEHIYPKWLQRKFNLWNRNLVLLNQSQIKYRNLTVPCCKNCNSIMSKYLEKPIERAVELGYEEFIKLDKKIVFQWLNKLSYGILFKELSLKTDQSNKDSPTIYTKELLMLHRMQHLFLRSVIDDSDYIGKPYSLLIFKLNIENNDELYWARDNIHHKTFFMRLNDVGIIANLMDNGYHEDFFMEMPRMSDLTEKELHLIQFAELCAKIHYKSNLFHIQPIYTMTFDENKKIKHIISHAISGDAFNIWSQEDYSRYLEVYWEKWGLRFKDIYHGNDLVVSFLYNEDGSFKYDLLIKSPNG